MGRREGHGLRQCACLQAAPASPAAVAQLWGRRYDGHDRDHAYATVFSPDGTKVFVTGATRVSSPSDDDMLTIAYDAATGATLWSRRFSGPTHELDQAYALGVSSDGSKLFVTGTSRSSTGFDSLTIAYDTATGQRLWLKRYNPNANLDDASYALAVSPDGSKVFVTGFSEQVVAGGSFRSVALTLAYDAATGATIWLGRYHTGSNGDDGKAIAVSLDGTKVFVAVASHGQTDDYRTVAYAAVSGTQLWAVRYDGFARSDRISSLAVNPDGSTVYVTGTIAYSTG